MKSELVGIKDGVELYEPVPENEVDERELKVNEECFFDFFADLILKYCNKMSEENDS